MEDNSYNKVLSISFAFELLGRGYGYSKLPLEPPLNQDQELIRRANTRKAMNCRKTGCSSSQGFRQCC